MMRNNTIKITPIAPDYNVPFRKRLEVYLAPKKYKVAENFRSELPDGTMAFIPEGFVTDGGSVPRFLWWFINPFDPAMIEEFVVHDFGYKYNYLLHGPNGNLIKHDKAGQKFFDHLLKDQIEMRGISVLSKVAFFALRLLGFMAWQKHRRRK